MGCSKKGSAPRDAVPSCSYITIPNVTTSNDYDILSEDEEAPSIIAASATAKQQKSKIPPITVTGTQVGDVHKKITSVGVVNYTTNCTYKGIVVNTTTSKDFKLVVDVLKRHNNSFYTQLPEEKTTKVVIFGLPEQDTEYIKTVLAEVNIAPCVIKKLELKKKRYDDQCMYLLHFPRGSITLSELKQVRAVDHHRVYFEYYSNKYGPMQCTNCQRYGHGSANCYLPPVCVKCADKHTSKTCPLSQTTTCPDGKIAPAKLKCANCSEHHTANFSGCPARLRLKKVTPTPSRSREFTYNETSFPRLPNTPTRSTPSNHVNFSDLFHQQQTRSNNNLDFDLNEIGQIVKDVFSNLSKCSSKQDLIAVIVQISAKYCFPNLK